MRFLTALFCGALCFSLAGCGDSYPYYTIEGTMESRVLTVHVDADTTREISIGTASGGLTGKNRADLQGGSTITVENHGVSVTLSGKTDAIEVGEVKYDGKVVKPSKNLL